MKILLIHNKYQKVGGEDVVAVSEKNLLTARGHHVVEYLRDNDEIAAYGLLRKVTLIPRTVWAWDSVRDLRIVLRRERPDIAHFHNTFPLISPAAYYACHEARVPLVQTLHNYRLLCPAGSFFRDGSTCEECLEHSLWRGVRHGCYRDSRALTSAVTLMLAVHRNLGTWTRGVNCFIAPSEFTRGKYVEGGLPPKKIKVKPNFVSADPGCRVGTGDYALFIGRLFPEKRVITLLEAWRRLPPGIPLRIIGSGPDQQSLECYASRNALHDVHFCGELPHNGVIEALKGARFLIFPSEWYETFGMTMIEAFACGVPVICSRLGAMQEIVAHDRTGLYFTPGDSDDLAAKINWAWSHLAEMTEMGRAARAEYQAKYTPERNYNMLMQIYERAIEDGHVPVESQINTFLDEQPVSHSSVEAVLRERS